MHVIALLPTRPHPQLRHHLMNVVDDSVGAAELRVSGIAGFSPLRFHQSITALTVLHGWHCTTFLPIF
jgi:hypothetical protein